MRLDKIASIFGIIMILVATINLITTGTLERNHTDAIVISMGAMLFVVITCHIASLRKEMKEEIEEVKEEIKNLHTLIKAN